MKTPPADLAFMQENAARAETMLKMLANAKRLMILCHLVKQRRSVGQLADLVGLSQSALSQHLAKMRELNIVETEKQAQTVYYRLCNPEAEAILGALYEIYCAEKPSGS